MNFIQSNKWLLPSLIFSSVLIITRVACTGSLCFLFLLWNLFLAAIPLYMAGKLEYASSKTIGWAYAALWLLFFPNAMYIVTDLFHLKEQDDMPLWYDLLLLMSAALNGVIMGFISLFHVEKWMNGFMKKKYIPVVIFALLLLCGYGIYLGRYERWNSWDIVAQPFALLLNIKHHVTHPLRNRDTWAVSVSFGVWMYLLYRFMRRLNTNMVSRN